MRETIVCQPFFIIVDGDTVNLAIPRKTRRHSWATMPFSPVQHRVIPVKAARNGLADVTVMVPPAVPQPYHPDEGARKTNQDLLCLVVTVGVLTANT